MFGAAAGALKAREAAAELSTFEEGAELFLDVARQRSGIGVGEGALQAVELGSDEVKEQ